MFRSSLLKKRDPSITFLSAVKYVSVRDPGRCELPGQPVQVILSDVQLSAASGRGRLVIVLGLVEEEVGRQFLVFVAGEVSLSGLLAAESKATQLHIVLA